VQTIGQRFLVFLYALQDFSAALEFFNCFKYHGLFTCSSLKVLTAVVSVQNPNRFVGMKI